MTLFWSFANPVQEGIFKNSLALKNNSYSHLEYGVAGVHGGVSLESVGITCARTSVCV